MKVHITEIDYTPKKWSKDKNEPLVVHIYGANHKGKYVHIKLLNTSPRFWVGQDPDTVDGFKKWKNVVTRVERHGSAIDGKPLWAIHTKYPWQISGIVNDLFPEESYCADVPYRIAVRMIYQIGPVIEMPNVDTINPDGFKNVEWTEDDLNVRPFVLDIETDDSYGINIEDAPAPIISICLIDCKTKTTYIGCVDKFRAERVENELRDAALLLDLCEDAEPDTPPTPWEGKVESYYSVNTGKCEPRYDEEEREALMLKWFDQLLKEVKPNLLIGHNVYGFDIRYLKNRCRRMNNEINKHNKEEALRSLPRMKFPSLYWLNQCQAFDTKDAYAETIEGEVRVRGGASLQWMSKQVLGYGKVGRGSTIDLLRNDPERLMLYNIWDCVVVDRVIEEMAMLPYYLYRMAFHNSTFEHAHSSMMMIERLLMFRLWKKGEILPSISWVKANLLTAGVEQGGFVADAAVGVFDKMFELDNSQEYPSAIITANMDTKTQVKNPEKYEGKFPWPVAILPSGRVYRQDIEGIMPTILREMSKRRDSLKARMNKLRGSNPALAKALNFQQRVMKENMNSWYGLTGSGATAKTAKRPFRLANSGIGSDTTEIARIHQWWNKDKIEETPLTINLHGKDVVVHVDVVYQDTDSCKCRIVNLEEIEADIGELTEYDVEDIGMAFAKFLNSTYDAFVQEKLGLPGNVYFNIKFEDAYKRYFQWGAKKRYVYLTYDGEVHYKGVEIRRSNAAKVQQETLRIILEGIMYGTPLNQINTQVQEGLDSWKSQPNMWGKPIGYKSDNPTTFQGKAVAYSNLHLGTEFQVGDKPSFYYVKGVVGKPMPRGKVVALPYYATPEEYGVVIDHDICIKKYLHDSTSLKGILDAVGTSWDNLMAGVQRGSFDDFFA